VTPSGSIYRLESRVECQMGYPDSGIPPAILVQDKVSI